MKSLKSKIKKLTIGVALMSGALLAGPSSHPRNIEDQVRHEILMVPYIGVFDNPSWQVENGVVTLSGEVTQPVDKQNLEQAVKGVEGVARVENNIEVLPLSPFDDQIRVRTLHTLLRNAPLDKYFQGVQPSIRIIVKNGHVTLDGVVLNNADRQFAFMAANSVPGVFSVTNNLRTEK
ncbi:MAG: BON domain-containing protein [Acidobacteriota bacterium]|nr:BON domain-containing protein [Acidobacteriota bacterium]